MKAPMVEIFEAQRADPISPPQRRLQLDKSQTITNYTELPKQMYRRHNVLQKAKYMENRMKSDIIKEERNKPDKEFSALDLERVMCMNKATRKIREEEQLKYAWSSALNMVGGEVIYCKRKRPMFREEIKNLDTENRRNTLEMEERGGEDLGCIYLDLVKA